MVRHTRIYANTTLSRKNYLFFTIWFFVTSIFTAILRPVLCLSLLLSVHYALSMAGLLPGVVIFHQAGDRFVGQLENTQIQNRSIQNSTTITICRMRWKLLPWNWNACSNSTLSSTVHSSGKGVKLARSMTARSRSCLCQNSIPRACSPL